MSQALEDFDEAIRIEAENPDIYCHRGQLYILQSELANALVDLRKV